MKFRPCLEIFGNCDDKLIKKQAMLIWPRRSVNNIFYFYVTFADESFDLSIFSLYSYFLMVLFL
jgi:hypothetical protein